MENIKLEEINGNEIIEFLNKESFNNEDLCDISISSNSFVFENQEIKKGIYKLYFTASFNNWGTHQEITGNYIAIDKKGIRFHLEEPFEGDGTNTALEGVLKYWIKNHKFDTNSEEKFYAILSHTYEQLPNISFESKKELQKIIDTLTKAQTYMK